MLIRILIYVCVFSSVICAITVAGDDDPEEAQAGANGKADQGGPDFDALGGAQIVITAATPMVEEPEKPFPPPPEEDVSVDEPSPSADEQPPKYSSTVADPGGEGSTGSDDDTSYTGPSTADNSTSGKVTTGVTEKKQEIIPDELEPHQLARLQDLKESDA